MCGAALSGWLCQQHLRPWAGVGVLLAVALCAAPAPAAEPLPAPVHDAFLEHKRVVLDLESTLRTAPDTALTGLPGFSVVLLACEGTGCVGAHAVRLSGADVGPAVEATLPSVFSAGGWLPVAVAGTGGAPVRIGWRLDGKDREAAFLLPSPGEVVVAERRGDEIAVRAVTEPGPTEAWRVALAERARGDRLAAIAALAAAVRMHPDAPATPRLLLADLYREAGLTDEADGLYRVLAGNPDPNTAARARIGRAEIALSRDRPEAVAALLRPVDLPPSHPLAGRAADVRIRALLAQGQGREAIRLQPVAGGDPFAAANRAMAFMSVGDTFSAVQDLEAAARAANRSVPEEAYLRERALLALGLLYGEQGRLEDALGAFARMAPGGPLADRIRFGRGMAFFHHEDLVKAVAEFQALERDHPDSPYALEGALIMADAYRRLNAPLRAVTEYRKALESFRARAASTDRALAEADGRSFDEGLTGLIFSDAWKNPERTGPGARERPGRLEGLQLLLHAPGFASLLDEYRQVVLTIDRLEGLNRRLAGRGQADAAARVSAAVDRLGVFRSMFEAAARQAVIGILKDERERLEDLSLTASLGITQSILFDRMGADGRDLYFKDAP
jgi:tetratricopeptide (TPR) repeat protein